MSYGGGNSTPSEQVTLTATTAPVVAVTNNGGPNVQTAGLDDEADHHRATNSDEGNGKKRFLSTKKLTLVILALSVFVLIAVGLVATFVPRSMSFGPDPSEGDSSVGGGKSVTRNYEDRLVNFRTALAIHSDPTKFSDPSTPQSRALNWLVFEDLTVDDDVSEGSEQQRLLQRYAMMVLFYACSGEDWRGLLVPLDEQPDVHECDFLGVKCGNETAEKKETIVELDLPNQRMVGPVPDEIGLLTSLQFLNLADNFLEGTIPDVIYTKLTDLGKT